MCISRKWPIGTLLALNNLSECFLDVCFLRKAMGEMVWPALPFMASNLANLGFRPADWAVEKGEPFYSVKTIADDTFGPSTILYLHVLYFTFSWTFKTDLVGINAQGSVQQNVGEIASKVHVCTFVVIKIFHGNKHIGVNERKKTSLSLGSPLSSTVRCLQTNSKRWRDMKRPKFAAGNGPLLLVVVRVYDGHQREGRQAWSIKDQ